MNDTFFMGKTYVVASIMKTKSKHFNENFVTYEELNCISNELQKKYNEKNIPVCIVEGYNRSYFVYNEVILLNKLNDVATIEGIENRYKGFCPSLDVLKILWDDKYILSLLIDIKQEELDKARKDINK